MKLYNVNNETLYNDFLILWIEYHNNFIKESTYANYLQVIHNKLLPFMKHLKIKDINKKIIQHFIIEQKVSTKTIKDYVIVIKQSLNYLFENEIIEEFSFSKLKYKKQTKNKVVFLNKEEYNKLKNYLVENINYKKQYKYNLGILLSLSTGMRIGEVCALKFKDIDLERNLINVNSTLQRIYIPNKGSKIIIGTPKSNSSCRTIPMNKYLKYILSKLEYEENNFVIRNEKPIEPRLLRNALNRTFKHLEMKKIKFHALRHTFATLCISNGVDIKTTSELLGHANADMTLNIYTHTTAEQKQKAIEKLQNL